MGDLFVHKPVERLTDKERLFRAIFGDGDKAWLERDNEAREVMDKYITEHPEDLDSAITTPDELLMCVRNEMEDARIEYIEDREAGKCDKEDDFLFAHRIMIMRTIEWIIREFMEREGNSYIHLCGKGCEAVCKREKRRNNR